MTTDAQNYPITRLRVAADAIRGDHSTAFWAAVADWLDREATLHETMTALADLTEAVMQDRDPKATLRINWDDDSHAAASTIPQALAVAETYLAQRVTA